MSAKTKLDAVQSLLAEGKKHWDAGRPMEALIFYERAHGALEADAKCKPINRVIVGQNLAVAQFESGQLGEALSLVDRLISLEATKDFIDLELDLMRLKATILERRSDLPGAAKVLAEIRPNEVAASEHIVKWNNAAGIVAWRRGLVSDALMHFRAAVAAMPTIDQNARLVSAVLSNAAILNYEIGDFDTGHSLHERMVELVSDTGTIASRRGLVRLEALRSELAFNPQRAAELWESGIEMVRERCPDEVSFQLEFAAPAAKLWARIGKNDYAVSILEQVRDRVPLPDRGEIGIPDILLADLLITNGATDRARRLLMNVADQTALHDDIESQSFLCAVFARLAENDQAAVLLGKLAISGLLARGAVARTDDVAAAQASMRTTLDRLKDALHRSGRYAEAARIQHISENRTAEPQDFAARAFDGAGGDLLFTPAEAHAAAGWMFLPLPEPATCARAPITSLLKFNEMPMPAKATALDKQLADGVVRVQYVVGQDTIEILAQRGVETVRETLTIPPAKVFSLIGHLRTTLVQPDGWQQLATELYNLLIMPIAPLLECADRLELLTSRALNDVPFACLLGPNGFLCEAFPLHRVIAYDTSEKPSGHSKPIKIAAFGGKGDTQNFARAELDHIASIFSSAKCFHNRHSSLKNFQMQLSDGLTHLHYSGHFSLNPVRPELSRLTFGSGEDLYLGDLKSGAYEMSGLELACFSACETGAAGTTAQGPSGLANVVLEQGARHVLATHWPVLDSEAGMMIANFYNQLAANACCNPVEALHQVQSRAARATRTALQEQAASHVGGIGSGSIGLSPMIWAGFSLYSRI